MPSIASPSLTAFLPLGGVLPGLGRERLAPGSSAACPVLEGDFLLPALVPGMWSQFTRGQPPPLPLDSKEAGGWRAGQAGPAGTKAVRPFLPSLLPSASPHVHFWRLGTQRSPRDRCHPAIEAPLGLPPSCLPWHQPISPSLWPGLPGQPDSGLALGGGSHGTKPRPSRWELMQVVGAAGGLKPGAPVMPTSRGALPIPVPGGWRGPKCSQPRASQTQTAGCALLCHGRG